MFKFNILDKTPIFHFKTIFLILTWMFIIKCANFWEKGKILCIVIRFLKNISKSRNLNKHFTLCIIFLLFFPKVQKVAFFNFRFPHWVINYFLMGIYKLVHLIKKHIYLYSFLTYPKILRFKCITV